MAIAPDELRALSRLAFAELARAPAGIGECIARSRIGRSAPPGRRAPSRPAHDVIAAGVYAALRGTVAAARRALAGARAGARALHHAAGAAVLGALNGLHRRRARGRGQRAPSSRCRCASAVERARARRARARRARTATPRLVVFVHGLFETELAWGSAAASHVRRRGSPRDPASRRSTSASTAASTSPRTGARSPTCSTRSSTSGRRASSGSRWSATRWAASWRAAPATTRAARGDAWAGSVRHVVSLGSPHTGAPLAEAVHLAGAALRRAAGDAAVRRLPAPPQRRHPRPAPRLAGRGGLARPRPGRAARRRLPRGAAARRRDPLLRGRDDHAQPGHPVARAGRRLARARASASAAAAPATAPQEDGCTSAARTTSRCSTTRASTSGCANGSRSACTRSASQSTAASCSGFMSTLRRMRAAGASASRWGWSAVRAPASTRSVLRNTGSSGSSMPGAQDRGAGPVERREARRRRQVGDDVQLGLEVERASRPGCAAKATAARRAALTNGASGTPRSVSQSAAAAAPAREHSRLISPRCSSSDVK